MWPDNIIALPLLQNTTRAVPTRETSTLCVDLPRCDSRAFWSVPPPLPTKKKVLHHYLDSSAVVPDKLRNTPPRRVPAGMYVLHMWYVRKDVEYVS